jgi:hypothetical protein
METDPASRACLSLLQTKGLQPYPGALCTFYLGVKTTRDPSMTEVLRNRYLLCVGFCLCEEWEGESLREPGPDCLMHRERRLPP